MIVRIRAADISLEDFRRRFFLANQPCIITDLPFPEGFEKWQNDHQKLDIAHLLEKFGEEVVPVSNCDSAGSYGEEEKLSMKFCDFIEQSHSEKKLYLKDWHFLTCVPEFKPPIYFREDWLNDDFDIQHSGESSNIARLLDYRFVYIGPEGTTTPLHHDVLYTYSWSINIYGCKRWLLFPPGESKKLYDRKQKIVARTVLGPSFCESKGNEEFPHLREAAGIDVIQNCGEAIFVPSGWHHEVVNLGKPLTCSVNSNFFNAYNLRQVWNFLKKELLSVRAEILHLRDDMNRSDGPGSWEEHCEVILRANSAMNVTDFLSLLARRQHFMPPHHFSLTEMHYVLEDALTVGDPPVASHLTAFAWGGEQGIGALNALICSINNKLMLLEDKQV
jgi:hypothetical protein